MKRAILEYKSVWSPYGDFNWKFRPIWVLTTYKNTHRIWGIREPFTRLVHKQSGHEKVKAL